MNFFSYIPFIYLFLLFFFLGLPPPTFVFSSRNFCEYNGFQDFHTTIPESTSDFVIYYKTWRANFKKHIETRIRCRNGTCQIIDV